jgi:glycosyltransferase involved in cell wall biosynthesis
MLVHLISGKCPYNLYQEESLQNAGVDAKIKGAYGQHLPDYIDEILAEKPDIIHLQWPEAVTEHGGKSKQVVIEDLRTTFDKIKSADIPIFWAHHNLLPHKRERIDMWQDVFGLFAKYCDVACHHSHCGSTVMQETYDYGECEHLVLHHGYFHKESTCTLDTSAARKQLELDLSAQIYFGFGAIRKDKHIDELLDCFAQLDPQRHQLVLAGNVWDDYGKAMEAKAAQMDNVRVEVGFIEEERASLYATAADSFIYAYGANHLTSGSPHTSQAHLLPQITLDYPYVREVLGHAASYIPNDEHCYDALIETLNNLDHDQLAEQRRIIEETRDAWYWPTIAEQTKAAYEKALQ